jgi:putative alpha-1,2-mannosidase
VDLNCFHNEPAGIPGDDDSGAMSAWYIFTALGAYPEIPGAGGVTILSPLFPKAIVRLPNGKEIRIRAAEASDENKYIQSLTVNGQPSSHLWLTVEQLKKGCALDYIMGNQPNTNWGVSHADAPPSFEPNSTGQGM